MKPTIARKEQVSAMFNNIAKKYDFLNHFLSAGIDRLWRRKLVARLLREKPNLVLDVATGTGDLAIELARRSRARITGVDIAQAMLDIGKTKIEKRGLEKQISLQWADSEALPFDTETFDAAMVAFGVRNFEDLHQGLSEMCRVLKNGGTVAVLEFSRPKAFPFKQLYDFYFKNILPLMGRMVSKDPSAYSYLPESVYHFPDGQAFLDHLKQAGFDQTEQKRLSLGIATLYTAKKVSDTIRA